MLKKKKKETPDQNTVGDEKSKQQCNIKYRGSKTLKTFKATEKIIKRGFDICREAIILEEADKRC